MLRDGAFPRMFPISMAIVISLFLLGIGITLILISLIRPVTSRSMESLRYKVAPGRSNRSWLVSGGVIVALGGAVMLLLSRYLVP